MMDEELHLQPVPTRDTIRAAAVIGLATLNRHLIPLVPFLRAGPDAGLVTAIVPERYRPLRGRRIYRGSLVGTGEGRPEVRGHRPRRRGDRLFVGRLFNSAGLRTGRWRSAPSLEIEQPKRGFSTDLLGNYTVQRDR